MVEVNNSVTGRYGVNAYQQSLRNDNTRSQAEIIDENNRLNREQERGFAPVNEENFESFDVTIPSRSEINYESRLQQLNAENSRLQRSQNERRDLEEFRDRTLRERGIGVNINVLI
jgi:hypothetical protein